MPRKSWVMVPVALGLILGVGMWGTGDEPKATPAAPQSNGANETIGERLGDAVQHFKRGAQTASETFKEEYQKARNSVHDMSVQARVYSRLHWDKDLNMSAIDMEFKSGTITLRGNVKSLTAKAKAIELARDTVGVDRVDDHLTIETAAPVTEPGTPAKVTP